MLPEEYKNTKIGDTEGSLTNIKLYIIFKQQKQDFSRRPDPGMEEA